LQGWILAHASPKRLGEQFRDHTANLSSKHEQGEDRNALLTERNFSNPTFSNQERKVKWLERNHGKFNLWASTREKLFAIQSIDSWEKIKMVKILRRENQQK
jgi:hypothetical protein